MAVDGNCGGLLVNIYLGGSWRYWSEAEHSRDYFTLSLYWFLYILVCLKAIQAFTLYCVALKAHHMPIYRLMQSTMHRYGKLRLSNSCGCLVSWKPTRLSAQRYIAMLDSVAVYCATWTVACTISYMQYAAEVQESASHIHTTDRKYLKVMPLHFSRDQNIFQPALKT